MDRSWMQIHTRSHPEYVKGVRQFLEFAITHMEEGMDKIRCPCYKCNNCCERSLDQVEDHLYINGIVRGYSQWIHHGEGFESSSNDEDDGEPDNAFDEEEDIEVDDIQEMLHDIHAGTLMDDWVGEASTSHGPNMSNPNSEADKFTRLMRDAEQELYPGCQTFSMLSFIVKLLHLKLISRWSNKSFTMLLELLKMVLPIGAKIPNSYYEAKKIIRDLGLNYVKIHVCKNDCVLFWKKYENEQMCPICNAPRWKINDGKGRMVPYKVLRYFPLKPRLQRLFISKNTAVDMRWHFEKRVDDRVLRHPADSEVWKEFDQQHESFASDPRNVRLGLASDGFNPFDMRSNYSMWPVILVPYNLPPWKYMKDPYFILSLLIPGPKAPGNDIDVFLYPLIDELKELWDAGIETYDASIQKSFQLHAALLWTINDFPAYANLSGWSTKGKLACPVCNKDTCSLWLKNGRKCCYMGHRRFLPPDHKWRESKCFDGKKEHGSEPKLLSGDEVLEQLSHVEQPTFGKAAPKSKKRKRASIYLNWTKKSVFFELPYWRSIKLHHNLDVMHIEKNVCDNVLGTLMNAEGKTKDTDKARLDLEAMGIRHELHPRHDSGKIFLPPACYTLSPAEKKGLCEFLSSVKFPNGYASNISHCVSTMDGRIIGLKCHDCHGLLQRLLPIAIRGYMRKDVCKALIELSMFFKELTSRSLRLEVLERLNRDIVLILCKLEKIYPPAFFDVMVHLTVHLAREAMIAGPVQFRWMYPFERYMHILKGYVRNKARPEGSIAEGYIDNECMTFCSMYLHGVETRFNRAERNCDEDDGHQLNGLSIFSQKARGLGRAIDDELNLTDLAKVRWYVLYNCEEVQPYLMEHRDLLHKQSARDVDKRQELQFHEWFFKHVTRLRDEGCASVTDDLMSLARGPDKRVIRYNGCIINGRRFHTKDREMQRRSQNSGVVVKAEHNGEPIDFYGILTDVIQCSYTGRKRVFLFKCDWWDIGNAKKGIHIDEHNFISINVTRTWYKDEPFVLACQAEQVFYLNDIKLGNNWRVVERYSAREVYDIPEEEDKEEEVGEVPYQQHESYGITDNVEADDVMLELHRDDMAEIEVDANVRLHEEDEDAAFINDGNDLEDCALIDDDSDEDNILIDEDDEIPTDEDSDGDTMMQYI